MRFLKPNLVKIVLAVALFLVSGYYWKFIGISDIHPFGAPFFATVATYNCGPAIDPCTEVRWGGLAADLLIWYIVGALVVEWFTPKRK
ncbi:MAG: hypothetical protein HY869_17720 [Chloroflexi bacterium]|nr:hypothetical protein [Chloroflexota bacterium]